MFSKLEYTFLYSTSFQDDSRVSFFEGHFHSSYLPAFIRSSHRNWGHYVRVIFYQGVQPGIDLEGEICLFNLS
jgi:hypothetical protein